MLLQVDDLVVDYEGRPRLLGRSAPVRAVNGVSFSINAGQTLGLVGESGSGKSSIGNAVLGLVGAASGSIRFDGHELTGTRRYPGTIRRNIQAVFQNPGASLDPSMLVSQIMTEPLEIHQLHERARWHDVIVAVLELVGLAGEHLERSPHEFSGGQRQRIAIARALILEPALLVLDEAVSALDASTQSQIINLLHDLQERLGLTYLFISHDLAVVHHVSDRIAVMYGGTIVEQGPADKVFERPAHPYTATLLDAVPRLEPGRRTARTRDTSGVVDRTTIPVHGCAYQLRCPMATERCRDERPPAIEAEPDSSVACFYPLTTADAQSAT